MVAQSGPGRPVLALALLLLLVTYGQAGPQTAHYDIEYLTQLQEKIINDTAPFRGAHSCYRGHCGPWIEDTFYTYYTKEKLNFFPYVFLVRPRAS